MGKTNLDRLRELTDLLTSAEAGPRVLICEDERAISSVLCEAMLQIRPTLQIDIASDYDAALAATEAPIRCHMAWVDVVLGGRPHAGLEIARRIRRAAPDVPVVICSGIYSEDVIAQALEAIGTPLFIRKPFSIDDVRAVMRLCGLLGRMPCSDCPRLFAGGQPVQIAKEDRSDA